MQISPSPHPIFQNSLIPDNTHLVGYTALVAVLGVQTPVRYPSCVSAAHIQGNIRQEGSWQIYDKRYRPQDTLSGHLTFLLKHENLDLLSLKRIFDAVPEAAMIGFIQEAPSGIPNRRAWFLYEWLTGKHLALPDAAPNIPAVNALDTERYFTSTAVMSKRHRVKNNMLGTGRFCTIIRKTNTLNQLQSLQLAESAKTIVGHVSNQLLARAASFMLLADSRASFEIEGERPPRERLELWVKAVKQAGKYPLTLNEISRLQGILIKDNRFVQLGLRHKGVFLGERDHHQEPLPEFIGAKPQDLPMLIDGLLDMHKHMQANGLDPILQAAAVAFGFVYIHPLEDGNGRLHRYLIDHVLAERAFTPPGLVFPVASVLLERIKDYQQILQNHSSPLMAFIDWRPTLDGNVEVTNDTTDLYRYYDCTEAAAFLYQCVQRTIEHDLPHEIEYLKRHDDAMQKLMNTVALTNRLADDFILFTRQNNGVLPKSRRKQTFKDLTDTEVDTLEAIVQQAFKGFPPG
jgi:hypothetical protein